MKGRFEDYQKYLDTLNGKIEGVNKDIEELREKFNEEDMEKDN
jgi:peptidoglycan hydrolase CwlO-like protein